MTDNEMLVGSNLLVVLVTLIGAYVTGRDSRKHDVKMAQMDDDDKRRFIELFDEAFKREQAFAHKEKGDESFQYEPDFLEKFEEKQNDKEHA